MGYKTSISDFEILNSLETLRFFQRFFFIFSKNSRKFKMFKKRNICNRRSSKECMFQVSSNFLQKRVFYSILNVKNGYFSGHLDLIPCISIYSVYSNFYAINDDLRSFFAFRRKKNP